MSKKAKYPHPLKREIYKQGYTIENFALESGVSRFTLNDIFKDKQKRVRGTTIYLISNALNKPYEDIEKLCNTR